MKKLLSMLLAFICLVPMAAIAEADFEDHFFLQRMNHGSCRSLTGDITLYVVLAEIPGAPWDQPAWAAAQATLEDACAYLEQHAAAYNQSLSLTISCHTAPSLPPVDDQNQSDWVDLALEYAGLPERSGDSLYVKQHSPILVLFNASGRNFAVAGTEDDFCEYLFLHKDFGQSSVIHELLHLYGARDYYYPDAYQHAAEGCFPESVMLSYACCTIDSLTAYCIGWDFSMDDEAVSFLNEISPITQEEYDAALEQANFTGYGTREYDGYSYTGDWRMGQWHGQGILTWDSGTQYIGEFQQSKRCGTGKLLYADGGIFTGTFEDSKQHGYGVMVWKDQELYAGNWENDAARGKAVRVLSNGAVYYGQMENYVLQGPGIQIWDDGSVYKGDFIDGKRTGTGTFIWADGGVYTGGFLDGHLNGYGIYISPDGTKMEGQWLNDALLPPEAASR